MVSKGAYPRIIPVLATTFPGTLLPPHNTCWEAIRGIANHDTRGRKPTASDRTTAPVPQHRNPSTGTMSALQGWRETNGLHPDVLWKEPVAIDVTEVPQAGRNEPDIRIVHTRVNLLIADVALPENRRIAWSTRSPFEPGDALQPPDLSDPALLRISR